MYGKALPVPRVAITTRTQAGALTECLARVRGLRLLQTLHW